MVNDFAGLKWAPKNCLGDHPMLMSAVLFDVGLVSAPSLRIAALLCGRSRVCCISALCRTGQPGPIRFWWGKCFPTHATLAHRWSKRKCHFRISSISFASPCRPVCLIFCASASRAVRWVATVRCKDSMSEFDIASGRLLQCQQIRVDEKQPHLMHRISVLGVGSLIPCSS